MELNDLVKTAYDLVKLLDHVADESLPEKIVDIVKLHAKLAVGSAWIPVPGADVAAGAVNVWSMYLRINSSIDMSFSENVLKTIASGLATNLSSYFAVLAVGGALKFIPGLGSVGGALAMSAALYAVTLASGYVYLKALVLLLKKNKNINDVNLKESMDSVLKNNMNEIKDFMDEAKRSYKK